MPDHNFSTYISPLSWRYGSEEMRQVWSERRKFQVWRSIWVALAAAQHKAGLISKEAYEDLQAHQEDIDIDRIIEIESETRHDVVAAVKEFAEKASVGGGIIHLGATSMDVVDNADTIRTLQALEYIEAEVISVLDAFAEQVEKHADRTTMGYTHLQPAEPTTVGYRLAFYAQDLLEDLTTLEFVKLRIFGKGFKGAVGTSASYAALLEKSDMSAADLEAHIMVTLGLTAAPVTSQVRSRKGDYAIASLLAGICSSMAKFAGDLRILQSANFGEWSEPFTKTQVGSSAMPFKKNPISAEKICSLARYVQQLPAVALGNATLSYLERTLDDSANRRFHIAESFLITDEVLRETRRLVEGLTIYPKRIEANLEKYGPFAALEVVLLEATTAGADRQHMHEVLREVSMRAWQDVQEGLDNPLKHLLVATKEVTEFVSQDRLEVLFDVSAYVGDAPSRAIDTANVIRKKLKEYA